MVWIDSQPQRRIELGREEWFDVSPGRHMAEIAAGRKRTETLDFEIGPGDRIDLVCGTDDSLGRTDRDEQIMLMRFPPTAILLQELSLKNLHLRFA